LPVMRFSSSVSLSSPPELGVAKSPLGTARSCYPLRLEALNQFFIYPTVAPSSVVG
jgi:hypothetical protein